MLSWATKSKYMYVLLFCRHIKQTILDRNILLQHVNVTRLLNLNAKSLKEREQVCSGVVCVKLLHMP